MVKKPPYEYGERWTPREIPNQPHLNARERFERLSLETLRSEFLHAVNEIEPALLSELFDLLAEMCGSSSGRHKALIGWATKWRLKETWLIHRAIRSLEHWIAYPPQEALEWYFPEVPTPAFELEPFRIELVLGPFDPSRSNRSEFVWGFNARVKDSRKDMQAYLSDAERRAQAAGLVRVPEKRRPIHFKWLAGFQVRRWSYRKIAEASDMSSVRTVAYAVKTLAKQIRLELRDKSDYDRAQDVGTIRDALGIPRANRQIMR